MRRRRVGLLLAAGPVIGFAANIFAGLVAASGLSGRAPAAWTPPVVAVLLDMTTLLRVEDG